MQTVRRVVWIFTAFCLAGCYTFSAARQATSLPGTIVALDINDRGRVALGGAIGPEVSQVEGRMVSMDTSEYVLHVTGVHFLRGGEQAWTGELVHIRSDYVSSRYERHFSPVRSALLGAVAVGAIAAVAAAGLSGLGTGDADQRKPDSSATQVRLPRRP